jgi:hypothetical protein
MAAFVGSSASAFKKGSDIVAPIQDDNTRDTPEQVVDEEHRIGEDHARGTASFVAMVRKVKIAKNPVHHEWDGRHESPISEVFDGMSVDRVEDIAY